MFIGACARRVPGLGEGGLQRLMLGLEFLHRAMLRRCIGLCGLLFLLQLDAGLLQLDARLLPRCRQRVLELTAPCLGRFHGCPVSLRSGRGVLPRLGECVLKVGPAGLGRVHGCVVSLGGGGCVLPCLGEGIEQILFLGFEPRKCLAMVFCACPGAVHGLLKSLLLGLPFGFRLLEDAGEPKDFRLCGLQLCFSLLGAFLRCRGGGLEGCQFRLCRCVGRFRFLGNPQRFGQAGDLRLGGFEGRGCLMPGRTAGLQFTLECLELLSGRCGLLLDGRHCKPERRDLPLVRCVGWGRWGGDRGLGCGRPGGRMWVRPGTGLIRLRIVHQGKCRTGFGSIWVVDQGERALRIGVGGGICLRDRGCFGWVRWVLRWHRSGWQVCSDDGSRCHAQLLGQPVVQPGTGDGNPDQPVGRRCHPHQWEGGPDPPLLYGHCDGHVGETRLVAQCRKDASRVRRGGIDHHHLRFDGQQQGIRCRSQRHDRGPIDEVRGQGSGEVATTEDTDQEGVGGHRGSPSPWSRPPRERSEGEYAMSSALSERSMPIVRSYAARFMESDRSVWATFAASASLQAIPFMWSLRRVSLAACSQRRLSRRSAWSIRSCGSSWCTPSTL